MEKEIYLALEIENDCVQSCLWRIDGGKGEILSVGEKEQWEGTKEELMVACDNTISSAVTKYSFESKKIPDKVIFGLPKNWTEGSKIVAQRNSDLQYLANKLSLKPLGFVVNPEAICFALKKKEKDFNAAVLIYVGSKELVVSLITEGKVRNSEIVGRSENLALDVEEGVLRFSGIDNLPPRILLYNSDDLEAARQTLIAYPWQPSSEGERPGFLHLPRVEVLAENFSIEALISAGQDEVIKAGGLKIGEKAEEKSQEKEVVFGEEESLSDEKLLNEDQGPAKEELFSSVPEATIRFVKEKDILEEEGLPEEEENQQIQTSDSLSEISTVKDGGRGEENDSQVRFVKTQTPNPSPFFPKVISFLSSGLTGIFKFINVRLSSVKEFSGNRTPKLRWLLFLLFSFTILFFLAFTLTAKAKLTLTLMPKVIDKEIDFQIDPQITSLEKERAALPFHLVSTEVDKNKTVSVSGKKTVGEKAKGEVTVYNRTEQAKTFLPGTVLIGPGKLKFVLETEVMVASKTPDLVSGIDRWGEAKATVTAADIGVQYNLGAASQFSFENFSASSFLAKNQVAFLGGTSRQISVVSRQDQEGLLASLTNDSKAEAIENLANKIPPGESLLLETTEMKVLEKKFDYEIDDETSNLNLELKIEARVKAIKNDDLFALVLDSLPSDSVLGFELEEDKTEIKILGSVDEEESKFSAQIKTIFKPKLDYQTIVGEIKGKSVAAAQKKLSEIEAIKHLKIEIYPGIFRFLSRLPFNSDKISVDVQTE